jgi:hypothetical protein
MAVTLKVNQNMWSPLVSTLIHLGEDQGDGTYEYTEQCGKGTILEGCEGLHTIIDQNTEGEVPKGWSIWTGRW